MARIRTIKPEFFRHEALQDLEIAHPGHYCMLVFAGLWGHCDSKGRFEWRPRQLKLDILPFLPFDMAETLGLLERSGMVNRYAVDGKEYGEIASFEKHQRITGKEATEGEKHPGNNGETIGKKREYPQAIGEQPVAQEGKGREEEREGKRKAAASPPDPEQTTRVGLLSRRLRELGIAAAPHLFAHSEWQALLAKFDDESIVGAAELALARKPGERLGINYLVPILNEPAKPPPAAKKSDPPWWSSEALMVSKGKELGLSPRPGEDWPQFRGRINERMAHDAVTGARKSA